ncbi:MAG TPA: hypothetical protein VMA72_02590 [Streptosporangiaceae bacterium]|nr:hypothetical protein [Streptosporangiaceae bacterium]
MIAPLAGQLATANDRVLSSTGQLTGASVRLALACGWPPGLEAAHLSAGAPSIHPSAAP